LDECRCHRSLLRELMEVELRACRASGHPRGAIAAA
jgi:hypothetical protein